MCRAVEGGLPHRRFSVFTAPARNPAATEPKIEQPIGPQYSIVNGQAASMTAGRAGRYRRSPESRSRSKAVHKWRISTGAKLEALLHLRNVRDRSISPDD